jgi:Carbohydrate binding domain
MRRLTERDRESTRRASLMERLGGIASSRDYPWPLILAAVAVFGSATANLARFPGAAIAVMLATACLAAPPSVAAAIVIVAANDRHLLRDGAFGPITPVDCAIASLFCRAALSASRRRPTWLEWCALGFLLAGSAATAFATKDNATTAFARVASYLVAGLTVGRALEPSGRVRVAQAFVGAAAGQATAALAGVTPTSPTSFPIGRYLGTLNDPAQFGIPVAFAGTLVALSSYIVRPRLPRYALSALFCVAVAGSVTRSAWAVLGAAFLAAAVLRVSRGQSTVKRIAVAAAGVAAGFAAAATAVLGAGTLGFGEDSARIRSRSLHASWTYLTAHPARPIGLGTPAAVTLGTQNADRVVVSTFDTSASRWLPYGATLSRTNSDAFNGTSALRVRTFGREDTEGVGLSVGGMASNSPYTLSADAKIPSGITLWLYADEYDDRGRWQSYKYARARGRGRWTHYSWTWTTTRRTDNVKIYVVVATKRRATFLIDSVRLDSGRVALPFDGRELIPPEAVSVSSTYNTWLAVAINLGVVAAAFLAALAAGAPYHTYRLRDQATSIALGALLLPSMTEGFVYAASLVTLTWLGALGLTATATPHGTARKTTEEDLPGP